MDNIQIRLGHTDSVNSVDRQNFLDVELKNTTKLMHFTDIKATVDQYEQFTKERNNCSRYRLITTINPYCTNVLFNSFTEIVYAEGSPDKCDAIIDGDSFNDDSTSKAQKTQNVFGLDNPNRVQMIMNTEYSKPGNANDSTDKKGVKITDEKYVYHPGFDIFDNHILRNKSFKIVNKLTTEDNSEDTRKFFNTIADKMRFADGNRVEYNRRDSFEENGDGDITKRDRHLYDHDDILEFGNGDAINACLMEENGWYGFINPSTIQSRDFKKNFDELNIGRTINYGKSCEFVDMYPDRTLYSFNPKYNKYMHREEQNWEVILTYPYEKTVMDDKGYYQVVQDGVCNGLSLLSAEKTSGPNGETVILLRCLTKHGLKRGNNVMFYYKDENDEWKAIEKNFVVRNVGDLSGKEKEYYFYINDLDFIRLSDSSQTDNSDNELTVKKYEYRFTRVVGNVKSSYYIRKFRKLPNFKFAKQNFPKDDSMTIDDYISENAYTSYNDNGKGKEGEMTLFDKEQYKLAFESTIYNDDSTQITFTDTIDIDNLVDDRGCPITEIYTTIVKTNYGHDKWYSSRSVSANRGDESIEYSHCFGNITSGLQFSQNENDHYKEYIDGTTILERRLKCGDVCQISHRIPDTDKRFETNIDIRNNDVFLGDLVEFNPNECIEKVLQPFMHRFNTAQRELMDDRIFRWHEIWSDDWDAQPTDDTKVITDISDSDYVFSVIEDYVDGDTSATDRPEGYYYQPHYRIPVREFGAVVQGQHYDININKIVPVQADGMYIKITTIRRSGVDKGDIIYMFDSEDNSRIYEFIVTYVENRVTFYIQPYLRKPYDMSVTSPWSGFRFNWIEICTKAVPDDSGKTRFCFRRRNDEIPPYAEKVGKNKFLWRDVLKVGNKDVENLPEYAFSNNAFYITNEINFFLKRQDPQDWNKLYCKKGFPNDIYGNIKKESNYIYKEEKEVVC